MSDSFISRDGYVVEDQGYRGFVVFDPGGEVSCFNSTDEAAALKEYFQAERDEALGRWRDTENPNVVVYPVPDQNDGYGRVVWVLDEAEMVSMTVLDDRHSPSSARRYFDAHPQPEPRPPFAAYVDKNGSAVWVTDENGNLRCLSDQNLDPEKYAPFTRLLPDE